MQKDMFNDIRKMGSHMLINSKQLKYAESFVNQLTKTETSVLNNLKSIKASRKQVVQQRIHQLSEHTLRILKRKTVYSSQLTLILRQFQFKVHKLMVLERFVNVKDLILTSIHQAVLTTEQRSKALDEITSTYEYVRVELLRVHKLGAFQPIFTDGVNSMNGALAKYVSQSQMCVLNHIQHRANHVKQGVDHQLHLSVTAKYIAFRNVDSILNKAKQELITTTNFSGLHNIEVYCLKGLQQIASDESRSLNNLTSFTNFTNKLTAIVTKLSHLSADTRLRLKTWIIRHQQTFITNVQQSNQDISDPAVKAKELHISVKLVDLASNGYQQEINSHTVNLSDTQRKKLVGYIDKVTQKLINSLQSGKSMDVLIKKNFDQLNQQIAKRENKLVYQNRNQEIIDNFKLKINNLYELSSVNKRNLQSQVVTFGHLATEKNLKTLNVDTYLQNWLSKQVKYLFHSTLQKQIRDLDREINFSHLASIKKQDLLQRLTRIKNSRDTDYEHQQTLIRDVRNYGLSLDKSVNLHKLSALDEIIYQQVRTFSITAKQGRKLSQNFVSFSQQINGIKQISAVDHLEQTYEDRIYGFLSHPNLDASPLRIQALRYPISQANEARRKINLSVLDRSLRQFINDRIDKCLCAYLHSILLTDDKASVKRQLDEISRKIKEQLSWAFSWVKSSYVKQNDFMVLDTYHQLILYSHSNKILDQVELINSHISRAINNSGNLLHVEYANQHGRKALNDYANKMINAIDHPKADGHRSIEKMVASLNHQLEDSQIKTASAYVRLATRNRILQITNYYTYRVNQSIDGDIETNCNKCQESLSHVLRQSYHQEWLKANGQAQLSIQKLIHVPIDPKLKILHSLQHREMKVTDQIQSCDKQRLPDILKKNKAYIGQTVRHGIYLDPIKKRARNRLDQMVENIRSNFKQYTDDKIRTKALDRLNKLNVVIDNRVLNSHDKRIRALYRTEYKMLKSFEYKTIRKAQLKQFNSHAKKLEHQTHQLSLLGGKKLDQIDMQFNNGYHKAIYKINHASNVKKCIKNERQGEKEFKQIFADGQKIDKFKQQLKKKIVARAKSAHLEIKSLNNLQKKDKEDSYHLLKQIQQQTAQNIRDANGKKPVTRALDKGMLMVKQVIDKVSSAGVLVSAIRTANNQIAGSTLDPTQKKATLHQINQIINTGIKNQINSTPDVSNKFKHSSGFGSGSKPNFKSLIHKKVAAKEKRKHHHNFFGMGILIIFAATSIVFRQFLSVLTQLF